MVVVTAVGARSADIGDLTIVQVDYGHPDAARLIEAVQQEYVVRYGTPDESPVDPLMFQPPHGSFFVGYVDDEAVATGAWRHCGADRFGTTRTAEIKRMYVVPAAQRRGHARRMLAHLEAAAREAGYEAVVLESGDQQPEALALYASTGYVEIEGFGHYRCSPSARSLGKRL